VESCPQCGGIYFDADYSAAERVCTGCGFVDASFVVLLPQFENYSKSDQLFKRKAAYQRGYHFNERVAQWTGTGPKAPIFVVHAVLAEIIRRNLKNPFRVDSGFIKRICTSIGAAKYAERLVRLLAIERRLSFSLAGVESVIV